MVLEEIWGIPIERARSFLLSQPDVPAQDEHFCFGDCRLTLEALPPGQPGRIPFPRTRLRIEGPDNQVQVIHHRFLIPFLSAGG